MVVWWKRFWEPIRASILLEPSWGFPFLILIISSCSCLFILLPPPFWVGGRPLLSSSAGGPPWMNFWTSRKNQLFEIWYALRMSWRGLRRQQRMISRFLWAYSDSPSRSVGGFLKTLPKKQKGLAAVITTGRLGLFHFSHRLFN